MNKWKKMQKRVAEKVAKGMTQAQAYEEVKKEIVFGK